MRSIHPQAETPTDQGGANAADELGIPLGIERLAIGACFALFLGAVALFWPYTVDDAYIFYRYATHWAQGHGLVYNLGERVEGYTSPSWVLLLGVAVRSGLDPIVASKVLGLLFALLTLGLMVRIIRRLEEGRGQGTLLVALLLTVTNPVVAVNAVDGLETSLFMFLSVWSLHLFALPRDPPERRPWSVAVATLAYLTRPDGVLFAVALLACGAWHARRAPRACAPVDRDPATGVAEHSAPPARERWLRWTIEGALLVAAVVAAHIGWRWHVYGHPLPNTFYAKGGGTALLLTRGLTRLYDFTHHMGGPLLWLVCLVARLRPGWARFWNVAALLIALRLAFELWSGGEWMGYYRFLAPLVPLLYLFFAAGAMWCLIAVAHARAPAGLLPVQAGILALLAILVPLNGVWTLHASRYLLDYARGLEVAHIALGRDLAALARSGDLVACEDAGAIPYVSAMPAIDLLGLNDEHLGHLPGVFAWKHDVDYVLSRHPTFLVLIGRTAPGQPFQPGGTAAEPIMAHPGFVARYRFWRSYRFAPDYHLWVFAERSRLVP